MMRSLLAMFAVALSSASAACATPVPTQANNSMVKPECVVRLLVPSYPYVAITSVSSATLLATVNLDANAAIQSQHSEVISGDMGPRLADVLKAAVEPALRASTFNKACAGETVRLTFRFKIGQADADCPPQPNAPALTLETGCVWFEYPDTYEIVARPLPLNTSGSTKK
jgi:hypothetical protein